MFVTSLRCMAAATVVVLIALTAPAVEAQTAGLFTPVDEAPPSGPLDDITLRSRVVTIDLGQLDHAQAAVTDSSGQPTQTRDASPRIDKRSAAPEPGATLTPQSGSTTPWSRASWSGRNRRFRAGIRYQDARSTIRWGR